MFFNYFAPGQNGKGIFDSEAGISKHKVAPASLHGENLILPYDLFLYLQQYCTNVASKTFNAIHSPDVREYHCFDEGAF